MRLLRLLLVLALPLGAGGARADVNERTGDVVAVILPAGAAVGALVGKDHQGLGQLAAAYVSTMAIVYILKPTVDRTRPDGGGQSFPSGHAASAFAGAAFLQRRYGWRLGLPAYALASYVGWSRVEADRHHPSDIVASAAIGIGANLLFTHPRQPVALIVDPTRGAFLVSVAW